MTADGSQERLPNYILPAQLNLEPIQSRPVATAPPDKEHIVPEIEYYDLVVIDVGDEMYMSMLMEIKMKIVGSLTFLMNR